MNSMTGFGQASLEEAIYRLEVQVRSVNHRYLDIRLHSNRRSLSLSQEVEDIIKSRLARGHVEVNIKIDRDARAQVLALNDPVFSAYARLYDQAATSLGQEGPKDISWILDQEGVVDLVENEDEDLLLDLVGRGLNEAIDGLLEMRKSEGLLIGEDMEARLLRLEDLLAQVKARSLRSQEDKAKVLDSRVRDLVGEFELDSARLATEVAILLDKLSIDEEIVRMEAHLLQFHGIMTLKDPKGRKLDFLLQEMNREANTMASKVQDTQVLHNIVEIKADIEKLREQVQNIE